MAPRLRVDVELVRRGLARSREQAAALVAAGRVEIAGVPATKAATAVGPGTSLVVRPPRPDMPDYASRGGHKLAGALRLFAEQAPPLVVAGLRCLDAGASTGGFTDVLLRAGAAAVMAVDVGYGQLAWPLRTDERVTVLDRTNVRELSPGQIGGTCALTVADLSFISLRTVLPALARCTTPDGHLVLLVKPQFEVGRAALGAGGVVREPALRAAAVLDVAATGRSLGFLPRGVATSSLPGPSGNVEFLLWLAGPEAAAPAVALDLEAAVAAAVAPGQAAPEAGARMGASVDDPPNPGGSDGPDGPDGSDGSDRP